MSFADDYLAERVGHLVPPSLADEISLSVTRMSAYLNVPTELLMDEGVTRERKPLTRRQRFRSWRRSKIESARMAMAERAYRLIGGEDVPEAEW